MRSLFLSREHIPVFLTIGIVVILGCIYYFMYLPDNEANIKGWKFRTLQNIDKNIHAKIEIGHRQLQTYLKSKELENAVKRGKSLDPLNYFLEKQRSDNFPVTRIAKVGSNHPKKFILSDSSQINHATYALSLEYDFADFIKPLLPGNVFENYIVADSSAVLYETFPSGFDPSKDSSFTKKGRLSGSEIINKELAGTQQLLFVQPVKRSGDMDLYVIGLVSKDNFFHDKTRLPPRLILFLITLFILILVTFPIIKLYQLGEEDRLTRTDAISVTVVSMLLLSMLFLCFVKYGGRLSDNKANAKTVLADSMKSAFLKEITDTYNSLVALNHMVEKDAAFDNDFYNVGKVDSADNQSRIEINAAVKKIDLDRVFWMDENGTEFRTWKVSSVKTVFPGKFNKRDYFKNIRNGQSYRLDGPGNSQLYVDQVVSWISGRFLTDISIPSSFKNAKVAAISFRVKSLKDYKVPPGYTFAMIDEKGKVLYHSDSTKNLNENLFEEFSGAKNLKSCIKTGVASTFNTQYFGQEYDVLITAVGGGLPYYLVIMENRAFDEYRDINVYSFTISMQILVFVLITIQILVMFLVSAKRSLFKGQVFETDWIGPRDSSNWQYIISTGFNICLFIALCVAPYQTVLCRMFMLLVSITCMPVFLNALFAYKYHNKRSPSKWYKIKAGLWGLSIPILLNIIAWAVLEESRETLWAFERNFILGTALVFFAVHVFFDPENAKKNWLASSLKYNQTYTAVLVSWMLVTMGIPVIVFFKASYNYDQHLIARSQQLELLNANVRQARLNKSDKKTTDFTGDELNSLRYSFYKDNYWLSDSAGVGEREPEDTEADDEKIISLLQSLQMYESERIPSPLNLNQPASSDLSFYFNSLMKQVDKESDQTRTSVRVGKDKYLWVTSASLNAHLPDFFSRRGFFLWILFVLVLSGFYFVFHGLINKIFSIKIPRAAGLDSLDLTNLTDKTSQSHFFLIGHPRFGKLKVIDDVLEDLEEPPVKKCIIDISLIPEDDDAVSMKKWNARVADSCDNQYELIILNHFEYNFKNSRASYLKLKLLEKLINKANGSKILVLSTIHPNTILEFVSETASGGLGNQSVERWQEVLGKFRIILNQISEQKICAALGITPVQERNDSFVLKSVATSHHSYFAIWQSLSKEEKFLLYDLAEDGLVNSYDQTTLDLLLERGLIVHRDGRLRLFTRGFRHFVLGGLGPVEMGKIIEKINDNRNWNRIRVPLMLISLTILAFLLSSQREASTKLITSLGALVTVIPAIINFLGTLGGASVVKKPVA